MAGGDPGQYRRQAAGGRAAGVSGRARMELHLPVLGCRPPGCDDALAAEDVEIALERQRLCYVAATRPRDLLLLPRLSRGVAPGSWMAVVDLRLDALDACDADALPAARLPAAEEAANPQDRARFTAEAALIAAATLYRPRFLRHRIAAYAASAAG
jgi:exodeoxyribonuclease-5